MPQTPERKREYMRGYREKHRERIIAYLADWREANPDAHRLWCVANPERRRQHYRAKRAARKSGRPAGREALDYMTILSGDPCSYCGASMEHVDHIEAISRGGDGHWSNLTAACARCNIRKQDSALLVFLLAV